MEEHELPDELKEIREHVDYLDRHLADLNDRIHRTQIERHKSIDKLSILCEEHHHTFADGTLATLHSDMSGVSYDICQICGAFLDLEN